MITVGHAGSSVQIKLYHFGITPLFGFNITINCGTSTCDLVLNDSVKLVDCSVTSMYVSTGPLRAEQFYVLALGLPANDES